LKGTPTPEGPSGKQITTTTIRQLANGSATDHLDEYLNIWETTAMEAMKNLVDCVVNVFGGHYMRHPTPWRMLNVYLKLVRVEAFLVCSRALIVCIDSEKYVPLDGSIHWG
jgi:hypothetical protein